MNLGYLKRITEEEYDNLLSEQTYRRYNMPEMPKSYQEKIRHKGKDILLVHPIAKDRDASGKELKVWTIQRGTGVDAVFEKMTTSEFHKWFRKNKGKIPAGIKVGRKYDHDASHLNPDLAGQAITNFGGAMEDVTHLFKAEEDPDAEESEFEIIEREPPIDIDSLKLDSDAEEAAPAEGEKFGPQDEDDGVITFEPQEIVVARPPARRSTFDPTAPTAAEQAAQMSLPSEHLPGSGMSYQTPAQLEDLYETINPGRSLIAVKRILKEQGLLF